MIQAGRFEADRRPLGKWTGTILAKLKQTKLDVKLSEMLINGHCQVSRVMLEDYMRDHGEHGREGSFTEWDKCCKTFTSASNTATEERWGTAVEGQSVIIHKDKWMCRTGSTFSNAISSSHLLLDSFQVDSLQDTAAIFRGGWEGSSKCMLVSEAIHDDLCLSWMLSNTRRLFVFPPLVFRLFFYFFNPTPARFYSSMGGFSLNCKLMVWDASQFLYDFLVQLQRQKTHSQSALCWMKRATNFGCTINGSDVIVKWRTYWNELN